MKTYLKIGIAALILGFASWGCSKTAPEPENKPDEYVAAQRMPVFYEANPRVFASENRLKAIEGRLDAIKALGTDVLWIMPIYSMGEKYSLNSPYCIKDFKAIDPSYGTMEDLRSLVNAAHSKGMKVILDWVANHTAFDNAWVSEHPDWYPWNAYGDPDSPEGWGDVAELLFEITDEDGNTSLNKPLCDAMKDAMLYWVNNADIDGYRCDYAEGVPMEFWTETISAIKAIKSDAVMLAETASVDYFGAGFDYIYGWTYKSALLDLFKGGPAAYFDAALSMELNPLPEGKHYVRFITNHDQASEEKAGEEFGGPEGKLAAYAVTAFVGESPLIYSSQEVGYGDSLPFTKDNVIDWPLAAEFTDKYIQIMDIYTATADIRKGRPRFFSTQDMLSMYYINGEKELLLLVNTTGDDKPAAKVAIELVGKSYKDEITGGQITLGETIALGAYEYKILTK